MIFAHLRKYANIENRVWKLANWALKACGPKTSIWRAKLFTSKISGSKTRIWSADFDFF